MRERAKPGKWSRRFVEFVALFGPWAVLAGMVMMLWPVPFGGSTGFAIVSGKSMEPTFHTGDLVITKQRSAYKLGEVVVYKIPGTDTAAGREVVHRLHTRLPDATLLAQGDNNRTVDPWTITENDIVGSKWLMIPKGGLFLGFLRSPAAAAVLIGLLVAWVAWPRSLVDEDRDGSGDGVVTVTAHSANQQMSSSVPNHWLDDDGVPDVGVDRGDPRTFAPERHWLDDDGVSDVWVSFRGRAAALVAELGDDAGDVGDVGDVGDAGDGGDVGGLDILAPGRETVVGPETSDEDDWLHDRNNDWLSDANVADALDSAPFQRFGRPLANSKTDEQ